MQQHFATKSGVKSTLYKQDAHTFPLRLNTLLEEVVISTKSEFARRDDIVVQAAKLMLAFTNQKENRSRIIIFCK